jgi:hypothetical protein
MYETTNIILIENWIKFIYISISASGQMIKFTLRTVLWVQDFRFGRPPLASQVSKQKEMLTPHLLISPLLLLTSPHPPLGT